MDLYSGADDDSHMIIRNNTSNDHHEALDCTHTSIEAQYKESIMREARVKSYHEVANTSTSYTCRYQIWHC